VKKTFVSNGDAKGYVGVVCLLRIETKEQQWRMEEKTQEFKFRVSPLQKM
jgi:exonuclease III